MQCSINQNKTNGPLKMGEIFVYFTKENTKIANKWLTVCSIFLLMKIMQIKIVVRYKFIPSRVNKLKNIDHTTDFIHWWYQMLAIFWSNWEFSNVVDRNIQWSSPFEKLFLIKFNCVTILWHQSSTPR